MQVYQDSQTFARKQAAQAWAKRRETGLNEPGAIERANRSGTTVASMIEKYLEVYAKARPIGTTRKAILETIAKTCLGECADRRVVRDFIRWYKHEHCHSRIAASR